MYIEKAAARTMLELKHILSRWYIILPKVLFVAYVAQVPFRNIAYYRHEQRETLKDLGFEIFPEIAEDDKWISELVFMVLHGIGSFVMIVPWLSSYPHSKGVMGAVMAERWLDCLCVGHVLRFLTYTSTSLPGPATHCRPGAIEPDLYRPTELTTFFIRKSGGDDPNCGDLIFSGHMYQNIILSIVVTTYATRLFVVRAIRNIFVTMMWMLTVAQVPLIIASRNHYTVDLTVATYLAPLAWIALDRLHKPPSHVTDTTDGVDLVDESVVL